jgi:hypothetical protein
MGMYPAPRALEIRREDANRPTTAPGMPRDRARPPLGKASRNLPKNDSDFIWEGYDPQIAFHRL